MIPMYCRRTLRKIIFVMNALICVAVQLGYAAPVYAKDSHHPHYTGVNIATGGFGGKVLPGVYGQTYVYPQPKEYKSFLDVGMNTARIPFLWERVQPQPSGGLDAEEMKRLDQSIAGMSGYALIILDVHNYARYYGVSIGQGNVTQEMLADLWQKLAQHYKSNPRIAFGLMNEPSGITATEWRRAVDLSIVAIRKTGARNLILVPGNRWSGVLAWYTGGPESNAVALEGVRDPVNNFAIEMHIYYDFNSSGTHWVCPDAVTAQKGILKATAWLRKNNYRGFVGEFGSSADPICLNAMDNMLQAMDENSGSWLGWTYWAAGAWWGKYPMSIQPDTPGQIKPQTAVLKRHLNKN